MKSAPPTFAAQVVSHTQRGSSGPRAERKPPRTTNVSAGTGGIRFSTAAPMASAA